MTHSSEPTRPSGAYIEILYYMRQMVAHCSGQFRRQRCVCNDEMRGSGFFGTTIHNDKRELSITKALQQNAEVQVLPVVVTLWQHLLQLQIPPALKR